MNQEHRIRADTCAINWQNEYNDSISDYNTTNYYLGKDNCDTEKKIKQFGADNHQVYRINNAGINVCDLNSDATIRYKVIQDNPRAKVQLYPRVFAGVPNTEHGGLNVKVEDRVKVGQYSYCSKDCDSLAEKEFPVFIPLIPCLKKSMQNPCTVIQPDIKRGGISTRTKNYCITPEKK